MQRRERRQHAEADRQRLGDAQRPAPQPLRERLALEQLHRDEQLAAVLADLVDLADVRMIDARRRAGLAPEALARRLVAGQRGHRLERDGALEPLVARGVDDAHPALAELAHDGVVPDAGGQRFLRDVAGRARRPRRRRRACQPAIKSAQSSARSLIHQYETHKTSIISSEAGKFPGVA